MAYQSRDYESDMRWLYYAAAIIFVLGFLFFRPKPLPNPANSMAFGCYANPLAPSIKLDAQGMTIFQKEFPRIRFHLERHKTGITLTANAPISADHVEGRYLYSIDRKGEGRYLNFYTVISDRRYGVFDDSSLNGFTMLAEDGVYLPYQKSQIAQCE